MSCQQATRFITNNNNNSSVNQTIQSNSNCKNSNNSSHKNNTSNIIKANHITRGIIQQEDPYVFTESVPTTPPILFNTQKTRTRLNDLTSATSIGNLQQQQKLPLTEANGKIASNLNLIKTQASFLSPTTSTTNTCAVYTSKNNLTQSLTTTITKTNNNSNAKKLTNVCIVRPQLQTQQLNYYHHQQQQQQQQQQHHQNFSNTSSVYEGDLLKSISPPPLYTPPTPSLWQTPLLLETATPTCAKAANAAAPKTPPTTTTSQTVPPIMGCVTPTVQTVGTTTISINPPLTTTAMAKVAPIIVHAPLAPPPPPPSSQSPGQCLPPSKFHNHTLAQHLQKVECLKKSKKSIETETSFSNDAVSCETSPLKSSTTTPSSSSSSSSSCSITPSKSKNAGKADNHSDSEDLNEIPVNVIFRMDVVPQTNAKSSNNVQFVKPQTENDTERSAVPAAAPPQQSIQTAPAPASSPSPSTANTSLNKKLSIPASKSIATKQLQQQINMSSIQQQQQQQQQQHPQQQKQQQQNAIKSNASIALNPLQQHLTPNENAHRTSILPETSMRVLTKKAPSSLSPSSSPIVTNLKKKPPTHISNKTRKSNALPPTNLNLDLTYNWQRGCSTTKGAVAVVKISQQNIDLDTTHLATATGLPYCLQQHWFNSYDISKSDAVPLLLSGNNSPTTPSLFREERIAVYKQQLRRQAMQLLSTRSLQKLPLKVVKRRLLSVDRLLRKYQQSEQNKKKLPANLKRCCINGCDAYTLQMASHCQQHIVFNAAQQVFLPCTAKFADNTQCRVPVFDITHDLPLCMEHARKRDAYNRLLYEQRPRKISTNPPLVVNESILLTSKQSGSKRMDGLVSGRNSIKAQNYQNKQQQQQQQHPNILPPNNNKNSNDSKRPALVNQQARKRKMNVGLTANPVGRPQKRTKKAAEKSINALTATTINKHQQMPRLTSASLKRKSSTTSLESIASNSQHSTTSCTSQQQPQQQQQQQQQHHHHHHHQKYQRQQPHQQHLYGITPTICNTTSTTSLAPPALAPLSSGLVGHGLPQHLFSFGHDNHHRKTFQNQNQHYKQQQPLHPININEKHSFAASTTSTTTASTPTELKDFISQLSFISQKHTQAEAAVTDANLLNTNSNSNFTSSGMGSTTSLPTADDFLTQDMLSICENSSASSADTGLGGLSDPELMLGGPEDDIPLGDTHLLEEHDLENVLNSLPEDAFKELFTTVHQDESDEIERAIELADKHLKTLQQTIGSELGDFLDFSDDMLMDNGDLCNGSTANSVLDTSALYMGGTAGGPTSITVTNNGTQGGGAVIGSDTRGLVQT